MARLAQVATARQAQLQDGRRLGFAQFGDAEGAPVIVFHDLWGNRNIRHPDDSILARLGIRLIGIDRPGYGMSTRKRDRSIMDVVDDVMLLSKALQLDRFAVLGIPLADPTRWPAPIASRRSYGAAQWWHPCRRWITS